MADSPARLDIAEIPSEEDRARQHLAAEREYTHACRIGAAIFVLQCVGSLFVGLFFIAYAMHTTDTRWGRISFFGGLVLGNAGILLSIVHYASSAQERGDL